MTNTGTPLITVVIPTRNRSETLPFTIASCLAAADDGVDILVIDNFSDDATQEVLNGFGRRIRTIRAPQRLPMAKNWELALDHISSEFVAYIGDDDALLPGSVKTFREINKRFPETTVTWRKEQYYWPNFPVPGTAGLVSLTWSDLVEVRQTKPAVNRALRGAFAWDELPMIYNSFFKTSAIEGFLARYGTPFFRSTSPDIYSGFLCALLEDSYVWSARSMSVNGASASSTGATLFRATDQGPAEMFEMENREGGLRFNQSLDNIRLLPMIVAEAFLQAREVINGMGTERITVDVAELVGSCFEQLLSVPNSDFDRLAAEMVTFSDRYGLRDYALRLKAEVIRARNMSSETRVALEMFDPRKPTLIFDSRRTGVYDVAGVARLVQDLLDHPFVAAKIMAHPRWLRACVSSYGRVLRNRHNRHNRQVVQLDLRSADPRPTL